MQAGEGWRRRRRWSIRRKTSVDQTFSLRTVQFYQEQRPIESESESELGSISSPAHTSSNSQQSLNQWERESVSIAELQLQYSTSIVLQHRHIERRGHGHGHGRRHTSTRVSRENEVKKATDETEKSSCYWSPDFYLPFVILANRLVPGCLNNEKTTINNRAHSRSEQRLLSCRWLLSKPTKKPLTKNRESNWKENNDNHFKTKLKSQLLPLPVGRSVQAAKKQSDRVSLSIGQPSIRSPKRKHPCRCAVLCCAVLCCAGDYRTFSWSMVRTHNPRHKPTHNISKILFKKGPYIQSTVYFSALLV